MEHQPIPCWTDINGRAHTDFPILGASHAGTTEIQEGLSVFTEILTGGAPFTKDGVNLNGLLRVHNLMRTVTNLGRADLLRLLLVGKLDIEGVPAVDKRYAILGQLSGLFIILNRVKLPGFQNHYQEKLADVPDIWGFIPNLRHNPKVLV